MAELKAGGLAMVTGIWTYPEDNGKCVTLEMMVSIEGERGWKCTGDVIDVDGEIGVSYYRNENLMPIDGDDFSHEDEGQKELTHG